MRKSRRADNGDVILLKHTVAEQLRAEIVSGTLRPGEKIVEGGWARKFSVSQTSIREGINILAKEGFVTKAQGRSARVTNLSEEAVRQIYEMRGVLEGLAAKLAAHRDADTAAIEKTLIAMQDAVNRDDVAAVLEANLSFHLGLCRLSENPYLIEEVQRLVTPLFAFTGIRAIASGQSASLWIKDFPAFWRIIELVKEGEGELVEQYVKKVMDRIAATAYRSWERKPAREKKSYGTGRIGRLAHRD